MAFILSPHTDELNALIKAAQRDWRAWGRRLVDKVLEMTENGKRLPTNAALRAELHDLLRANELELRMRFAGTLPPNEWKEAMGLPNIKRAWAEGRSLIDVSARTALDNNYAKPRPFKPEPKGETSGQLRRRVSAVVQNAITRPLTKREAVAVDYAKRRAEIYMRRPAQFVTSEVERVLNDAELANLRRATAKGIATRQPQYRLKQQLEAALKGSPTLANDMDRVVRTELAFAHHSAAVVALREQSQRAGAGDDPLVVVLASPGACEDCRRIWGPRETPIPYRLSEIESASNFQIPRAQWGPQLPVHPHCTCPSPIRYSAKNLELIQQIQAAAAQTLKHYGQGA